MIGTSYAWWTTTAVQNGINEIQSDCLKIILKNEQNNITLKNAYPLTDEEAKELTPYTFKVKNECNTTVNYAVKLEKLKTEEQEEKDILKSEYVAVEVNGGQKQILSDYPTINPTYPGNDYKSIEGRNLINGTLKKQEEREYKIKLWMDEHVTLEDEATNKSFISKIVVEGNMNHLAEYTEPILHGADPVLEPTNKPVAMLTSNEVAEVTTGDKLIPVIIDEAGTVTKADTKEEWYNYENKEWANAIILLDNSKADTIKVGQEIPENQIESYFVWIPKYKYKIFDMGDYSSIETGEYVEKSQPIEIQFDLEDTKDEVDGECTSPNKSGEDGNCAVGQWMTHPAFTAFEGSHGMWVGKFETGYKQTEDFNIENWDKEGAQHNEEAPTKVIIKPNVYSWRNITVGNAYHTSYKYERDLDSHMMKNTEWGAVAYLSHSKYGTCDNDKCTEVRINNSSSYVTGVAAVKVPDTGYDVYSDYELTVPGSDNTKSHVYPNSKLASTTGNNTGIFDMSGGSWEYVMGYINGQIGNSGLTEQDLTETNAKYFDVYTNENKFKKRILGDATGELGQLYDHTKNEVSFWYDDWAYFPNSGYPLFRRGGDDVLGTYAGLFAYHREPSTNSSVDSFRIVLTPQ